MKPRTPGFWLIVATVGLLALLPMQALAGMTPEEVKMFTERKAKAEKGDAIAQYLLGYCYLTGAGVAKDAVESIKWFRKAADQDYAPAQNLLGIAYKAPRGVAKDDVESVKWFRKAADQGHAQAQYNLGGCYANGEGVAKDMVEAVKWLRKAADQGHAPAQTSLETMRATTAVPAADVKAFEEFRAQVNQGIPHARYKFTSGHYRGLGVEKDDIEALQWLHKAADQGNDSALELLVNIYFEGKAGAAKDQVEVVRLSRKGAEQGHLRFLNGLGLCYLNGYGVAKDQVEAYAYYSFADLISANSSITFLSKIEKAMAPESILRGKQRKKEIQREIETKGDWANSPEMKKKFKAMHDLADQGPIPAYFHDLGYLYAIGQGIPRDEAEAYAYLNLYNTSYPDEELSSSMLANLKKWMTPEQISRGQQRTKELQKEIETKIAAKKAGK
jgi:TPR repeat protein